MCHVLCWRSQTRYKHGWITKLNLPRRKYKLNLSNFLLFTVYHSWIFLCVRGLLGVSYVGGRKWVICTGKSGDFELCLKYADCKLLMSMIRSCCIQLFSFYNLNENIVANKFLLVLDSTLYLKASFYMSKICPGRRYIVTQGLVGTAKCFIWKNPV